jgi:transcriptional regulator with XRE-family HTH domain
MSDFLERWATENPGNARLVAEELLITQVAEEIWKALDEADLNKTDLAGKLSKSKGYITQLLNGSRNMTLRTLADICFALDKTPVIHLESKHPYSDWQSAGTTVFIAPAKVSYKPTAIVIVPEAGYWKSAA